MEFARSEPLAQDTIAVNISSLDEGKLFYALKNKNALQKEIMKSIATPYLKH